MKIHELIDFIQRKINSLLFRVTLISYSIVLINIYQNQFPIYIYLIATLLYFIGYNLLLKRPKLRLINDFLFIALILYGKNPNEILNFVFLLLPIINSINFSGHKKSPLLYFLTFTNYLVILCYYHNKFNLSYVLSNLYPLIPIIFLWFIDAYTSLRVKIRNFREELNAVVDNFYLKKEDIKRPHKIYKKLIEVIHKNLEYQLIEDIICLIVIKSHDEKLVVANGSSFIWEFKFKKNDVIKKLREKKSLINETAIIENNEKKYNLVLYTQAEDQEYIYIFITKETVPFYYILIGFFRTLAPSISKISRVLLSERKLQELKNEEIKKLSERSQYVNRANNTMHFMRNRLGPFSNLLKMLDNFETIPQDKLNSFKQLLSKEKDRARTELNNITERANDMLEKSKNPFVYNSLGQISLEKVFTILKRNFTSFFPEEILKVNITSSESKRYVLLNEEGFELFLSDWLNNMAKYRKSKVACEFLVERETLKILFYNDHNKTIEEVNQMISDLTSNDRNEIMKRTTHGLFIIKSTLEDMKTPFVIYQMEEQKNIVLKLQLKISEYENSSI